MTSSLIPLNHRPRVLACGFVTVDIIAAGLPEIPRPGEILYAPHGVRLWIGGHPANLAVGLIQLGLEKGTVGAALPIGDGPAGKFAEEFLRSRGVVCFFQRTRLADTGKVIVLVKSGEDKRFVSDTGANPYLTFAHVIKAVRLFEPRVLYLACGILGSLDLKVPELLRRCHESGILTIVDVFQPVGKNWDFIYPALPYIDIIHCNRNELRRISRLSDPDEALRFLTDRGVSLPIFSDAENGVKTIFRNSVIKQPGFTVKAIDPTGAGDALCAGLARTLVRFNAPFPGGLERPDIIEMLLYAQAAGAACASEIGTTTGVTKLSVHKLISQQGDRIRKQTCAY